ncbi:hypothetical protein ACN38_g8580 [Penicillium nordicum]|uniref:Uncharacterized protein n=1 Tax=Penicillium nordicum TaxID=229535 RepID=A0A0M8NZR7_9EURO|nr:hypothetical protein ACN38_g8580 [Penicillium nordicum]
MYTEHSTEMCCLSTLAMLWPNGGSRWFPPSGSELTEYSDSSKRLYHTTPPFKELTTLSTLAQAGYILEIQNFSYTYLSFDMAFF